jgi:hypothetical protein
MALTARCGHRDHVFLNCCQLIGLHRNETGGMLDPPLLRHSEDTYPPIAAERIAEDERTRQSQFRRAYVDCRNIRWIRL